MPFPCTVHKSRGTLHVQLICMGKKNRTCAYCMCMKPITFLPYFIAYIMITMGPARYILTLSQSMEILLGTRLHNPTRFLKL